MDFDLQATGGGAKVASRTPNTMQESTGDQSSQLPSGRGNRVTDDGSGFVFLSQSNNLDPAAIVSGGQQHLFIGDPRLVDVQPNGIQSGNDEAVNAVVSPDGRFVAFSSDADNLVAGVADPRRTGGFFPPDQTDVFLRDLLGQSTELISVSVDGATTGNNQSGASISSRLSISPDGRFVGFASRATDLVDGVNFFNGTTNIFLRDRQLGTTELISLAADGSSAANQTASNFFVSDDGRFVAYSSGATNLSDDGRAGVFLRDRSTATTTHISEGALEGMSRDGRFLLFSSNENNIVPGVVDDNGGLDLFQFDRVSGTVRLVSTRPDGSAAGISFDDREMTADGRFVAFVSSDPQLDPQRPLVDTPGGTSVYRWERDSGIVTLASLTNDGVEAAAGQLDISDDGRFVVFDSRATNLVGSGSRRRVFAADLQLGRVVLVSHAFTNAASGANGDSSNPQISGDGEVIVFQSNATNLVQGLADSNGGSDLFTSSVHRGLTLSVPANVANETLTLRKNGEFLELFSQLLNAPIRSLPLNEVQFVSVTSLASRGTQLIVDYGSGGEFQIPDGIEFHGASSGEDTLVIQGGAFDSMEYTGVGDGDGYLVHDENAIVFSGVARVTSEAPVANVEVAVGTFAFSGQELVAEAATFELSALPADSDRWLLTDGTSASLADLEFVRPSTSLRLQGDGGQDTFVIRGEFDGPTIHVDGADGVDQLTVESEGSLLEDRGNQIFSNGEVLLDYTGIEDVVLDGLDTVRGDFDGDLDVDADDIDILFAAIRDGSTDSRFDLNNDAVVDALDRDELVFRILNTFLGDANLDRQVDVSDFNLWNANKFQAGVGWAEGDFTGDGVADVSDFNLWNANKFQSFPSATQVRDATFFRWSEQGRASEKEDARNLRRIDQDDLWLEPPHLS